VAVAFDELALVIRPAGCRPVHQPRTHQTHQCSPPPCAATPATPPDWCPPLQHKPVSDTPARSRGPARIPRRSPQGSLLTLPRQSACISPPIA
jgi:hypothetical protein